MTPTKIAIIRYLLLLAVLFALGYGFAKITIARIHNDPRWHSLGDGCEQLADYQLWRHQDRTNTSAAKCAEKHMHGN